MENHNKTPSHHGVSNDTDSEFPNETMRLLLKRSSCRSFEDREISDDVLNLVFEAGTHAPTGGNLQPFSIIKITDPATRNRLCSLCENQQFIATAPVDLLFCLDWRRLSRWAALEKAPFAATHSFRHFWISFQDTIIAAQNMCTAADALGLGSVYVGTATECIRELREMFKLPAGVFPVVLLSMGYPKERPKPRRKLDIGVIVHDGAYRELSDDDLLKTYADKYPYPGVEATEERRTELERVCRTVHGDEFAREALDLVDERSVVNVVQRYFGLHYTADLVAERNEDFLEMMRESGFGCFDKYTPPAR